MVVLVLEAGQINKNTFFVKYLILLNKEIFFKTFFS